MSILGEQGQHGVRRFIANWFARGEVKTPLAFFFKVLPWLTGALGLILYAPIPSDLKLYLIKLVVAVFGGMFVFVGLFAWFNPRHLIYGESSHRFERKLEFGTEKKTYSPEELDQLQPIQNPQQLPPGPGEEPR